MESMSRRMVDIALLAIEKLAREDGIGYAWEAMIDADRQGTLRRLILVRAFNTVDDPDL